MKKNIIISGTIVSIMILSLLLNQKILNAQVVQESRNSKGISYTNINPATFGGLQGLATVLNIEVSTSTLKMIRSTRLNNIESRIEVLESKASTIDFVSLLKNWVGESISATFGIFKKVRVEDGIELKDKRTGQIYCVIVDEGVMKNIKGECGTPLPPPVIIPGTPPSPGGTPEI